MMKGRKSGYKIAYSKVFQSTGNNTLVGVAISLLECKEYILLMKNRNYQNLL